MKTKKILIPLIITILILGCSFTSLAAADSSRRLPTDTYGFSINAPGAFTSMYSDNAYKGFASIDVGVNALDYSGDYQTASAVAVKMSYNQNHEFYVHHTATTEVHFSPGNFLLYYTNDDDANADGNYFRLKCNTNGAGAFSVSGWWDP